MIPFLQVRATPVPCARPECGHSFADHGPGGGKCAEPCDCPGFRWVAAQGPPHGYTSPPRWT